MVRDGAQFISGLQDDRAVYVEGSRVGILDHRPFEGSLKGMAGYFDWQTRYASDCVVENETVGEATNASHIIPRNAEDIALRSRAFDRLARYSYGMLGRTPDYVNVTLAGFVARSDSFTVDGDPSFADRLKAFHREVATRDLSLTHAIVHPVVDKAIGPTEGANRDVATRVVRRTADHVVISGSKVLATLAPFSDEIFVYPSHPLPPNAPEGMALCFSIPVATPGLHIVCRDHFGLEASRGDRPFSSRFDEQDAFVIFDEVEIPRERLFIDGDVEAYNNVPRNGWMANILQQTCIRAAVKLEFAYDLCSAMARVLNATRSPETAQMLGELKTYANLARAAITAAETNAHDQGEGAFLPDPAPLRAVRNLMPSWMVRANEVIVAIGSHNLLCTPGLDSFADPTLGPLLDQYLIGARNVSAQERDLIFRTGWDFAGSALGARVALYEQFYLGSQGRNFALEQAIASREGRQDSLNAFLTEVKAEMESPAAARLAAE